MRRTLLFAFAAIALAGCDNPKSTVEQTQRDIAEYKQSPSDAGQAKIETDLAKLDTQVAKLESKGKSDEARTYRSTTENLRADYHAARMVRAMKDTQDAIKQIGGAFKQASESIGDVFRKDATPTPTP